MSNVTTVTIEIVDKATEHISIMSFVTEERDEKGFSRWTREASDANIEVELVKSGQDLTKISWRRIDRADIPASRDFRNSWRNNGGKLAVDMPLARADHMAKIRRRRDRVLIRKDAEWLREFSRGNQVAADAIEAERQVLRDIPATIQSTIDAATAPDTLKAVWPTALDR